MTPWPPRSTRSALAARGPNGVRRVHAWCGDITYVQVGGTWLYRACVLDICSRRVLGWSMATRMRTELVIDALKMAIAARGGHVDAVVFHADRGPQYTSAASPRPATISVSAGAWAVSGRATTAPWPRASGKA
ncbi:DDE-type integrase/transposase/recombinase [Streptomyces sp. NRRL F-2664]|uniref:DDE-type integrase/transposase/recombinase n=1 Tax=Streptomyces sp. NRRL F-2664 TaxID=1463842 RepID=UPI003B63A72F